MLVITANLNGIRSAAEKGFFAWMRESRADIVCVQELKAAATDLSDIMRSPPATDGPYRGYFFHAHKKGYSGVGLYTRHTPQEISMGMQHPVFDTEGRFLRADFENFSVISLYVPSGSSSEERQQAKFAFLDHLAQVMSAAWAEYRRSGQEFLFCGDWNIAHQAIDLKNWRGNQRNSGFLPEERAWLDRLYASGWVDIFRHVEPLSDETGYTWWSNRGQAWTKNVGWRIDLQVATPGLAACAQSTAIYKATRFSDHAPLSITYELSKSF
jgi:exodeoxyribonuclease-3